MAFTVTPTSGEGPYVYDISFDNKQNFGADYVFEVALGSNVGSCITDFAELPPATAMQIALLSDGTYFFPGASVPDGSCRTAIARVRRLLDDTIVSSELVAVDNI